MTIPQDWTPTTPEEVALVLDEEDDFDDDECEFGKGANTHELNEIERTESWRSQCY